jgi:DHA2 family multidrug resistance protein
VSGLQHVTHALVNRGLSQSQAAKAAVGEVYQSLQQQASMLSYVDVFHVLMVIVFASLPLVFLMRKAKKAPAGVAP